MLAPSISSRTDVTAKGGGEGNWEEHTNSLKQSSLDIINIGGYCSTIDDSVGVIIGFGDTSEIQESAGLAGNIGSGYHEQQICNNEIKQGFHFAISGEEISGGQGEWQDLSVKREA